MFSVSRRFIAGFPKPSTRVVSSYRRALMLSSNRVLLSTCGNSKTAPLVIGRCIGVLFMPGANCVPPTRIFLGKQSCCQRVVVVGKSLSDRDLPHRLDLDGRFLGVLAVGNYCAVRPRPRQAHRGQGNLGKRRQGGGCIDCGAVLTVRGARQRAPSGLAGEVRPACGNGDRPLASYCVFLASFTSWRTCIEVTVYSRSFVSPSRSSTYILSL